MRKLTKCEEIKILQMIANGQLKFLGRGSSRATFRFGKNMVVKVAYGQGGRVQNWQERQTYEKYPESVAEVIAYGSNILVSEKIVPLSSDERSNFEYWCEEVEDIEEEFERLAYDESYLGEEYEIDPKHWDCVYPILNAMSVCGYTVDCVQVGYSARDGKPKLYDAGFLVQGCDYDDDDDEYYDEDGCTLSRTCHRPHQVDSMEDFLEQYGVKFLAEFCISLLKKRPLIKNIDRAVCWSEFPQTINWSDYDSTTLNRLRGKKGREYVEMFAA